MFGCCRPTHGTEQFEEIVAPPGDAGAFIHPYLQEYRKPHVHEEALSQPVVEHVRKQEPYDVNDDDEAQHDDGHEGGDSTDLQLQPEDNQVSFQGPIITTDSHDGESSQDLPLTEVPAHPTISERSAPGVVSNASKGFESIRAPETVPVATSTATPIALQQATVMSPPAKTPDSSKPGGSTSVRDAQKQIQNAFKPKPEPKLKASPQKNWKPQNYSADVSGLRTKDRSKMIDLADEKFKKELLKAVNFVREISDKDARDVPEVPQREQAFLLYLFLQSVAYEVEGKQNPVSTVISQASANAEGEKALATTKVKAAAKRLQFMCKAYYKPALDQLQSPNPKLSVERVVDDFHTTAKVLFGDKPPTLVERVDPFMAKVLSTWKWEICRKWQVTEPQEFTIVMAKLLDAFETCRKNGGAYIAVVDAIVPKIS